MRFLANEISLAQRRATVDEDGHYCFVVAL
jgi:hypothetical protein